MLFAPVLATTRWKSPGRYGRARSEPNTDRNDEVDSSQTFVVSNIMINDNQSTPESTVATLSSGDKWPFREEFVIEAAESLGEHGEAE